MDIFHNDGPNISRNTSKCSTKRKSSVAREIIASYSHRPVDNSGIKAAQSEVQQDKLRSYIIARHSNVELDAKQSGFSQCPLIHLYTANNPADLIATEVLKLSAFKHSKQGCKKGSTKRSDAKSASKGKKPKIESSFLHNLRRDEYLQMYRETNVYARRKQSVCEKRFFIDTLKELQSKDAKDLSSECEDEPSCKSESYVNECPRLSNVIFSSEPTGLKLPNKKCDKNKKLSYTPSITERPEEAEIIVPVGMDDSPKNDSHYLQVTALSSPYFVRPNQRVPYYQIPTNMDIINSSTSFHSASVFNSPLSVVPILHGKSQTKGDT